MIATGFPPRLRLADADSVYVVLTHDIDRKADIKDLLPAGLIDAKEYIAERY